MVISVILLRSEVQGLIVNSIDWLKSIRSYVVVPFKIILVAVRLFRPDVGFVLRKRGAKLILFEHLCLISHLLIGVSLMVMRAADGRRVSLSIVLNGP